MRALAARAWATPASLIAAWLFVAIGAAFAQGEPERPDLIALSGLDATFAGFEETVRRSVREEDPEVDVEYRRAMRDAADAVKFAERLHARVAAGLDAALSDEQARTVAAFFASPLGERIVALEREASGYEAIRRAETEGETLRRQAQEDPERWAEYRALIENSGSEAVTEAMASGMFYAMVYGMTAAGGPLEGYVDAEIAALVEQELATMLPELAIDAERSVALTYRSLSLEDLRAYNAFLTSPDGAVFVSTTIRTLGEGLTEVMYDFGQRVAKALGRKDI